jgi:hypothetical protein
LVPARQQQIAEQRNIFLIVKNVFKENWEKLLNLFDLTFEENQGLFSHAKNLNEKKIVALIVQVFFCLKLRFQLQKKRFGSFAKIPIR